MAQKDAIGALQIHPKDALAHHIENGDWVHCISETGRIKIQTAVTPDIPRGILSMLHGCGFAYPTRRMNHLKLTVKMFLISIPLFAFLGYLDYKTTSLAQIFFTKDGLLFLFSTEFFLRFRVGL